MTPRRRLFRKYVIPVASVVCCALLANGLLEMWFAYRESTDTLTEIQHEKALAAAVRIETFVSEIERQIGWVMTPAATSGAAGIESRRLDFLRLQRQAPAITEVAWIDAAGREQLRVSRLAMEVVGSGTDLSNDPRFTGARPAKTWFGPVYFHKDSEPYMTIAVGSKQGVTTAEVNLKLMWDVVSQIKVGKRGHAYVVDASGLLLAHPDISLVLRKTDLSGSAQFRVARASTTSGALARTVEARDLVSDRRMLTAFTTIAPLGWIVFVEQPLADAFAPLWGSVLRTGLLMLLGVVLSVVASLVLARRMTRPIEALGESAARIGGGDLGHRIELHTGDELEALAEQFNTMTARLRESYATLEHRVEERTRELSESLEQQTATAEILRVISSSPTDVQPVFDTIVKSAARLCGGKFSSLYTYDGRLIHFAATSRGADEIKEIVRQQFPRPADASSFIGRAIAERAVINIGDMQTDPRANPAIGGVSSRRSDFRAMVIVPMFREGSPVGVITVGRAEAGVFAEKDVALLRIFADQAVIAIENVRLFTELQTRNREVTDALERQTATSEILRAISASPTDARPVFDTIVRSAARLCEARFAAVYGFDGEMLHFGASHGLDATALASLQSNFPRPLDGTSLVHAAIRERTVVLVADVEADPQTPSRSLAFARSVGARSQAVVPLLLEGRPIGAISLLRMDPVAVGEREIELLRTFADQAVIAIENVRLFTELQTRNREVTEALEQQTATAEILRVISSSPTDVQPVFDAIVDSATRLCAAQNGVLFRYDDVAFHTVACRGLSPEAEEHFRRHAARPTPSSGLGRVLATKRPVHLADVTDDLAHRQGDPLRARTVTLLGARTAMWLPLLKGDTVVGALAIYRHEVRPFTDKQIELVATFADQAVIAIENVRLFTELQTRNREVTEALEQQTATAEVLRVISTSPTDLQPVLHAIAERAARLCDAWNGTIVLREEDELRMEAHYGPLSDQVGTRLPIDRGTVSGRAFLDGQTVHVDDLPEAADFPFGREIAIRFGVRTVLGVPLVREGAPIGAILIRRTEVRRFSDKQIKLLETFADQAVIAIENVRLFTELRQRTGELTRSVEELTALGEVGRAVGSTLDLDTVLTTIVSRAVALSGAVAGTMFEYDEATEEFRLRASHNAQVELIDIQRAEPVRLGQGAVGQAAARREPVQVSDLREAPYYSARPRVRELLIESGYRSVLAVPLLVEDRILGALVVLRREVGEFSPETVNLLQTFATQSALAIQNARLFTEIEDKSRQLEVANRHKSEFLANMSHELRTPLNAVIGFSEVLLEKMFGELNAKQEEYLKDIYDSGRHLLSLINDILDLSKIEAGRMELELTQFDLPAAIDNALTLVKGRAANHAIALTARVDRRLGAFVADERKLKQILVNILSNAVKFTPEGGRVEVRAAPADRGVEIAVADTGIGIALDDQETIFEEFRQVGSDYARKREGTGLGLTLTRRMVELHGGRIWVKSAPGQGSTFTFTLPERAWPAS